MRALRLLCRQIEVWKAHSCGYKPSVWPSEPIEGNTGIGYLRLYVIQLYSLYAIIVALSIPRTAQYVLIRVGERKEESGEGERKNRYPPSSPNHQINLPQIHI
jgi:hypothetical protein